MRLCVCVGGEKSSFSPEPWSCCHLELCLCLLSSLRQTKKQTKKKKKKTQSNSFLINARDFSKFGAYLLLRSCRRPFDYFRDVDAHACEDLKKKKKKPTVTDQCESCEYCRKLSGRFGEKMKENMKDLCKYLLVKKKML